MCNLVCGHDSVKDAEHTLRAPYCLLYLRGQKFHTVTKGLFQNHDDRHLYEQVSDAATRVTLERNESQGTSIYLHLYNLYMSQFTYFFQSPVSCNTHIVSWVAIYSVFQEGNMKLVLISSGPGIKRQPWMQSFVMPWIISWACSPSL